MIEVVLLERHVNSVVNLVRRLTTRVVVDLDLRYVSHVTTAALRNVIVASIEQQRLLLLVALSSRDTAQLINSIRHDCCVYNNLSQCDKVN